MTDLERRILEAVPGSTVNAGGDVFGAMWEGGPDVYDVARMFTRLQNNGYIKHVGGNLYRRTPKGDEALEGADGG